MGVLGSLTVLLDFALGVYTWMILIRVLLSWVNPDPYNPIVQFLMRATDPLLEPLRRLLPPVAGLDLSPIVALLGLSLLQRLVAGMARGSMALSSLLLEVITLVHLLLTFYLLLLFVRGGLHIRSWLAFRRGRPVRINLANPLLRFVFQATEPLVRWLRPRLPTVYGLDISPLMAALAILVFLAILQDVTFRLMLHG
ncbi:YggT family protein [Candidatus Magnetaquicoccus inordinatus]|uniref:YggT family protein n=1 Tax=Candidatus Magnetaquicoccus inordinatus TaxID=2496818 RepID=UPI00102B8803|nr:YggT family protein [Candidatus Magnetaquicoccus inordinatus]